MQWGQGGSEYGDTANPQCLPSVVAKEEAPPAVPSSTAVTMAYTDLRRKGLTTFPYTTCDVKKPLSKGAQAEVTLKHSGVPVSWAVV